MAWKEEQEPIKLNYAQRKREGVIERVRDLWIKERTEGKREREKKGGRDSETWLTCFMIQPKPPQYLCDIITQISRQSLLTSPYTDTHTHINTYALLQWKFPHHDSCYDDNCYVQHYHSDVNKHHHQTAELPNTKKAKASKDKASKCYQTTYTCCSEALNESSEGSNCFASVALLLLMTC